MPENMAWTPPQMGTLCPMEYASDGHSLSYGYAGGGRREGGTGQGMIDFGGYGAEWWVAHTQ